mmetsp:Transcript_83432/g.244617  ORF Transcript_83432/g.244617 Transcript_83432/m.244617 type:complete len:252 (-) Transcript_83432:38-793(-)
MSPALRLRVDASSEEEVPAAPSAKSLRPAPSSSSGSGARRRPPMPCGWLALAPALRSTANCHWRCSSLFCWRSLASCCRKAASSSLSRQPSSERCCRGTKASSAMDTFAPGRGPLEPKATSARAALDALALPVRSLQAPSSAAAEGALPRPGSRRALPEILPAACCSREAAPMQDCAGSACRRPGRRARQQPAAEGAEEESAAARAGSASTTNAITSRGTCQHRGRRPSCSVLATMPRSTRMTACTDLFSP